MGIEFNPDGSIKLPGKIQESKDELETEFREGRVIRMTRVAISDSPLIDDLQILISPKVENPEKVVEIFHRATKLFRHMAQLTISKGSEREYIVRVVSGQYRDTWITSFRDYLRDQMKVKMQYLGHANDFRKGRR